MNSKFRRFEILLPLRFNDGSSVPQEFFSALEDRTAESVFRKLFDFANTLGAKRFYGSSAISFKVPDPKGSRQCVTLFVTDKYGEVYIGWTIQQLETLGLPTQLGVEYAKRIAALAPGVNPKSNNADFLNRGLSAEEVGKVLDPFKTTVTDFVEQIKQAKATQPKRANRGYDVFKKLLEKPIKREDLIAAMAKEEYPGTTALAYISWSKRVVDDKYNNPFYFEVESYKDDDGVIWLRKKPGRDFSDVDMDVVTDHTNWVGK